VSLAIISDPCH